MKKNRLCIKCGEPATKSLSPDLDIEGIPCCDAHVETVQTAFLLSLLNKELDFMKVLDRLGNKESKKVKK